MVVIRKASLLIALLFRHTIEPFLASSLMPSSVGERRNLSNPLYVLISSLISSRSLCNFCNLAVVPVIFCYKALTIREGDAVG
jgi:hypothetical protein